jgi:hypothetical protein
MAYSDFALDTVIRQFQLTQKRTSLFSQSEPVSISTWLQRSLQYGTKLALSSGSEKARSEFILAPILLELEQMFGDEIAIYSGKNLDADREKGLVGECDFIISIGEQALTIQMPILAIVEAKKADIELGLGQCVAQMLGAQLFNASQTADRLDINIYGCVTTGEDWQFLKLEENILYIDGDRYYINQIEKILGCLQSIIKQSIMN